MTTVRLEIVIDNEDADPEVVPWTLSAYLGGHLAADLIGLEPDGDGGIIGSDIPDMLRSLADLIDNRRVFG